jgi:hypothetical protein
MGRDCDGKKPLIGRDRGWEGGCGEMEDAVTGRDWKGNGKDAVIGRTMMVIR